MSAHPDLKLFITGSGISNPAINKAIEATHRQGQVYCTGMALPSTMQTYLADGTCKQFSLWDPKDYCYIATYAAVWLKAGLFEVKEGVTVTLPEIGPRPILANQEIDYGKPLFFTKQHPTFPS